MKKELFAGKLGKRRLLSLLIPIALAALLLFQVWFTGFSERKQLYIDLTSEGLYTLTDKMVEECEYIDDLEKEITVTFCAEPDQLRANAKARTVYFMCLALQKLYPNLAVKCVNLKTNPTAVNAYKTTSLSEIYATDIIISYGNSFRIASVDAFWTTDGEENLFSYNGEYKMATLFHSLTSKNHPVAYFITNHGELYFDTENKDHPGNADTESLYRLLTERGLVVKTLDLSAVEDVPEDCALLVINNPRADYAYDPSQAGSYTYQSETEKLDRYLTRDQGSLMVATDYRLVAENKLKNLEDFLYEWGFELGDKVLADEDAHLSSAVDPNKKTDLIGQYITEENTYAYAIYGAYASLASSPRMVISDAGEIRSAYDLGTGAPEAGSIKFSRYYSTFFSTTDKGKLLDGEGNAASEAAVRDICGVALRYGVDSTTLAHSYSYVFCVNSASFFSEQTLGNASFANYDITSALVENISREDVYASIDLGGSSLNSASYGGKRLHSAAVATATTEIYANDGSVIKTNQPLTAGAQTAIILIAVLIPLGVAITGLVIHLRRRFR
ncbi:MAG: Gldg family protein [Clostridia bacterium]|nr:Gldg family protein [Clostridia bacterium]